MVEATIAGAVAPGQRVVLGRVDGVLIAHRAPNPAHAADGLVVEATGERARVELLGDADDIESNVLVAGCAPLLGLLTTRLGRRYRDARATWIPANSTASLSLLAHRHVHLAGIHLAEAGDPQAHDVAAKAALPGQPTTLVHLAQWRQGLIVAPGNPLDLGEGSPLLRPGLRYAVREAGAGAQRVFERTMAAAGGAVPKGPLATDHHEVAQLVRWGVADVGVAVEAAALTDALGFVPLCDERFDLVVPTSRLDTPKVARFLDLLDRRAFRAEARGLQGYDLSQAGDVRTVAP